MSGLKEPLDGIKESIENERCEVESLYPESADYARQLKLGPPVYAFTDALMAEKVHLRLFEKALEELETRQDIAGESYYTCSSCGYTFTGSEPPKNCPVCGAPSDKIRSVE
jgi:rubrerythrin